MSRRLFRLLTALALIGPFLAPASAEASPGPRERMLVTHEWLSHHLRDPGLVLLHIGRKPDYDESHIPGARYLDLRSITVTSDSGVSYELPPVGVLDSVLAGLGVTASSRIVLYFATEWVSPTTRVWFTFDYLGLGERTSILDGGLQLWRKAGLPVTSEVPPPAKGELHSRAHPELVARADWLRGQLGSHSLTIVDARDPEFYRGLEPGAKPQGHIPGAVSLPFTSVVGDDHRFLSDAALRRLFAGAGVTPGRPIVVYCHVGQQATAVLFAGRLLGYQIKLYDGSFHDWSDRLGYAVEGGVPFTKASLITPSDLADRLAHDSLTVIDARSDLAAYLAGHVPGAAYLHFETLRATAGGVPGDTLSAAAYADLFGRLGLQRDRPVVVYGSGDAANFNATFLVWLLDGMRQREVYLLDGGFGRWSREQRPIDRTYPATQPTRYEADPWWLQMTSTTEVKRMLGQTWAKLVDVRPPDQYEGRAGAQLRRGHIPGAISHPWQSDLRPDGDGKVWKSAEELKASYEAQGITPDKFVILYCNTGTEASHAYFALHFLLGYQYVRVYVPSWTAWAAQTDLPVEGAQGAASAGN